MENFQEGLHGSTEALVAAGSGHAADVPGGGAPSPDAPGSVRAAIANAIVGLFKNHYGRGPTAAKAWLLDDYVFVAMEGGLTRSEETLLADGKEEEVRRFRLAFQETVSQTARRAVSELTGRRVLEYHSQIVFRPPRSFEIFVLEPARGAESASGLC
jgi:uncharacterized protein YbcI